MIQYAPSTGETIYTEGSWELQSGAGPTGFQLQHRCGDNDRWLATRWRWRDFDCPCTWCDSPVPKKLQTLYVLMTGDMEERP
jgi:hypothetical protein